MDIQLVDILHWLRPAGAAAALVMLGMLIQQQIDIRRMARALKKYEEETDD